MGVCVCVYVCVVCVCVCVCVCVASVFTCVNALNPFSLPPSPPPPLQLASEWDSLYVRYTQRTAHNKLSPLASDKATKSTPSSPIIRSKKATSSLISSERSSIPSMRYLEAIDTPERLRADSAPPTPPNSHQYVNIDTLSGRPQDLTSESEGDEEEEEEEEKEEEEEEVQPKNREAGRAGEGGGGGGGADSEYEVQYVNWQVLSDSKLAELSKPPPPKTPPPSSTVPPQARSQCPCREGRALTAPV